MIEPYTFVNGDTWGEDDAPAETPAPPQETTLARPRRRGGTTTGEGAA